jgi:hypothetical protein
MSAENNGGKPDKEIAEIVADKILALCPQTLNDLIEHKQMPFWRGETFKALYALQERAKRTKNSFSSTIRELNKVIYYANRGLNLENKNAANTRKTERNTTV